MEDTDDYSYGGRGSGSSSSGKKSKKKPKPPQKITLTDLDETYPGDVPPGTKKIDLDWREFLGAIREVMDQGNRRICWTVASTRSFSAHLVIKGIYSPPVCLSALHLLVGLIDKVDSTGGLANLEHFQKFMIECGTVAEEDCQCPQLALEIKNDDSKTNPSLCNDKGKNKHNRVYKVKDFVISDNVDEEKLLRLVTIGPVAVSIDVYHEFSKFRGDGIYTGPKKGSRKTDEHMLLVSGYGTTDEGVHFWRVQNSAGTLWGNNGFGKIIRKISREVGKSSLFTCIVYPTLLERYDGQLQNM